VSPLPVRDHPETVEHRRKKLMMKAREWGLTDEERMEFASQLLRRDITTWSTLDDAQVSRLLDAVEGFELMTELARQRG
jgi:vacuolar-type H+-ATPase subunit C/Vma6